MKILIIYAHPDNHTLPREVLDSFSAGLESKEHQVEIIDLHQIGFRSKTNRSEIYGNDLSDDVVEQQEKVSDADALAFITNTWWNGFPTILRGWIDRVLSYGFAYAASDNLLGTEGLLPHKKVAIIQFIDEDELDKATASKLASVERINTANFTDICGIPIVDQHFFSLNETILDDERIDKYLETAFILGQDFDKDLDWE